MPATEQTSRDQKLLHKIFAVSSVIMLIATVWMFAADHYRSWKPIQRSANRLETVLTDWRQLQFKSQEIVQERQRLEADLQAARDEPIDPTLLAMFQTQVVQQEPDGATVDTEGDREDQIRALQKTIGAARLKEDTLLARRKFKSADRDAAVAALGLLVRDGKDIESQQRKQAQIDAITQAFDDLDTEYQDANDHRIELERIVGLITKKETSAAEALDKAQADERQLVTANVERRSRYLEWNGFLPLPGKKWLELPILDAFNSPREIDNLWSDGLEIDYNFSSVRRFDRCTTCHQLIDKTMPGTPDVPAYEQEHLVQLQLAPPTAEQEDAAQEGSGQQAEDTDSETEAEQAQSPMELANAELQSKYGLQFAIEGLLKRTDVTVRYVRPESLAATAAVQLSAEQRAQQLGERISAQLLEAHAEDKAIQPGLQVGDVIVELDNDGNRVYDVTKVVTRLLRAAESSETVSLTVRRGMPHPYSSHPRLDLFVGSLSPHNLADFACTICHEGQGSGTAFQWASHSPNTARQRQDWMRDHGWFDNHHWIYPMHPKRFLESTCLKCHHRVTELAASPKFPQSSSPKLMRGYHLIRKYGCYGCHEVNGFDRGESIGPDLRIEPNVFAAAQQLKIDPGYGSLDETQQEWLEQLIQHPERGQVRRRLYEVLAADGESPQPKFSADAHSHVVPLLADVDSPGQLRKAGPSLRFVGHKLDGKFLYDWIREPKHFRPDTRMPQFFGLTKHLKDDHDSLESGERNEQIELLAMVTYLLGRTQEFAYLEPEEEAAAGSAERGRLLFQTKGCLACHSHKDFPDAAKYRPADEIQQGPDLSGIGDKFSVGDQSKSRRWLYSWIRQPTQYHVRTVMPDLFLESVTDKDGNVTDQAADIAEFLLSSSTDWQPRSDTPAGPTEVDSDLLLELVVENLQSVYSGSRSAEFAESGIPESHRADLRGAEVELISSKPLDNTQRLLYIGRKTIAKYGCYGCHDVPGFEDAKPIGTSLADWGRKDPSKLAFEHIIQYLEHGHGDAGHGSEHQEGEQHDDGGGAANHDATDTEETREFYHEQIAGGHRAGFIYQKLLEPRSFDYHKVGNKAYNERLRMPQFPFTAQQREEIITFVLGLVADPPSEKYVYRPDRQMEALIAGRRVIEKYNCRGCHMLEAQQWDVAYRPDERGDQGRPADFDFLKTHFTPDRLTESTKPDHGGRLNARLRGMPTIDDTATPLVNDDEGDPIEGDVEYDPTRLEFGFDLWRPAALAGNPYEVGVQPLFFQAGTISSKGSTDGGVLAKYLLRHVVARERQINPNAKGAEAWGWLPPPLIGEGRKVQSDWLYEFLLDPYPIRPAVVLRMPRFNMTPQEAIDLVAYFATVDDAEYPYDFNARQQTAHLGDEEKSYQAALSAAGGAASQSRTRFGDALNLIVDNNYCVKCHLVGDFEPKGDNRAKAPNLSRVYQRLRPEYVRNWLANPKWLLPYTGMPQNFKPGTPASQALVHGTSMEQIDAVVDLLMNFDEYAKQRSLIAPLVKDPPPAGTDGQPQPTATGAGSQ